MRGLIKTKMTLPEKYSQHAYEIEEAIVFLVTRMLESGYNPKPVIIHSVRMGVNLYNHNYELDIVKAAILHDIIEDSDTTVAEIEKRFGENVAQIVQAVTFDYNIGDRAAQGIECIQRCLNYGRDALIVKAADMLENSSYIVDPASSKAFSDFYVAEMRYLANVSHPIIGNESIWQELSQQCQKLETLLQQIDTQQ